MPFNRFKAEHAGQGPFQVAYGALFPEGILGRRGLADERELTDELIGQVRALEDVQGLDAMLAAAEQPLTREQHRAVRGALSQAVNDQRTINSGFEAFNREQTRLLNLNPADSEQLTTMASQMEIAHEYLLSVNPELQKAGTALAAKVLDAQSAYTTANEAQRIALGDEKWSRLQSVTDDLRTESTPYLTQARAWDGVIAALADPSAAGDMALLYGVLHVIEPTSNVMAGEFANAAGLVGVPDILVTARNKLRNGERFTPAERKEWYELARRMMETANEGQAERNQRYYDVGKAGDLDPSILDRAAIPLRALGPPLSDFGTEQTGEAVPGGEQTVGGVLRDTAIGIGDIYQFARRNWADDFETMFGPKEAPVPAPRRWPASGVIQRPVND